MIIQDVANRLGAGWNYGHPSEIMDDRHAKAIGSALELLELLQDRGVLDLLRGMVAAGDKVGDKLAAVAETPESMRAIRNFILLTKFFGSIPPDVLKSLVQTATDGAKWQRAHHAPGILQLMRRLFSKDSRHAIGVTLDLLESVGKGL
jgi:uncharacterized protein YjgD (DUF1641 family)